MSLTLRMDRFGRPVPGSEEQDEEPTIVDPEREETSRPSARRCPACVRAFSGEARFCPFDGDPLVDAPDWNPSADALLGRTVDGRYEVLSVLGEGGMGTVYEVRHKTLDRRFAMKVLRRDVGEDPDTTERFVREAKAAASIGHPNIVAVTDFGQLPADALPTGEKVPYFVMEHLVGVTLGALLKAEGVLTPKRGGRILLQCASALEAAHEAGILHRDLKPDNIFLTESGGHEFVKVLDFGVAKVAGSGRLTQIGRVFGTPHYMSPEQAAGQLTDRRADIYALGVIMYECFAGRVPFEADTYMGVLTQHMFAAPAPIERIAPDVEHLGALGPIAMRCLEKRPEDRFSSMTEVAEAIEEALSEPRLAAIASLPPPPGSSEAFRLREPVRMGRSSPSGSLLHPPRFSNRQIGIAVGAIAAASLLAILTWRALGTPSPVAAATSTEAVVAPVASIVAPAPAVDGPEAKTSVTLAPPDPAPEPVATSRKKPLAKPAKAPVKAPVAGAAKPSSKAGEVIDPWGN